MQLEQLLDIMKSCGIVGAGGAGFPSYAKLNKKADTVILNCAECEPLFRVHRQLLARYSYEILTALETVRKTLDAKEIIIAVKPSYKDAIEAVNERLDAFKNVTVHKLPEVYPAGDEIVTIYECTGKVVPPGALPVEVGCIVYNVETMLNTYYAITENRPVTHKYVMVGGAVKDSQTFYVPIGTKFKELVKMAGGATVEKPAYLNGGAMTGNLAKETDVVTKTTNAVLLLPEDHPVIAKRKTKITMKVKRSMSSCCQCRTCTDMCPRNLLGHPIEPHLVMRAVSKGMDTDIKAVLNTTYCAQCNLCELYACPQGLAPKSIIADLKSQLRERGIKPEPPQLAPVDSIRSYRQISTKRLLQRLGLTKYASKSPLNDNVIEQKELKIMLSQHIGEPAKPLVKVGDAVKFGDKIAIVKDKLGADISAPMSGKITEATETYLVIRSGR